MLSFSVFTGRLVSDPELRTTNNDIPVASFRIAVTRDFAAKGEEDNTDFFDIVAWRGTAEFVTNYFTKGKMITVTGRLKNRKWKDKEGNTRVSTELHADNVYFGESKPSDGNQSSGGTINPFAQGSAPATPVAQWGNAAGGKPPWEQ